VTDERMNPSGAMFKLMAVRLATGPMAAQTLATRAARSIDKVKERMIMIV